MRLSEICKKIYNMTIASSIICFVLGLLAFFEADLAVTTVTVVFGLVFMIIGLVIILNYFADGIMRLFFGYSLLYGLLFFVTGITMFFNSSAMYTIIAIFISCILLIEFISKAQLGLILKKYGVKGWGLQLFIALVLLLCSIIIVINPAHGALFITRIVSCIIMCVSALNIVDCIILKEKVMNVKKTIKDLLV